MKSKWLLILTYLLIGMAAFSGKTAYADTYLSGMYGDPASCVNWSFSDPNCSANLMRSGGKAAFGEITGQPMLSETTLNACEDWSFNTPGCAAFISRTEGKAAFGESTMPVFQPAAYCADWTFNDPNCEEKVRK